MSDLVLNYLREVRTILNDEKNELVKGGREVDMVITKIDEALLWRQEVLNIRQPAGHSIGDKLFELMPEDRV